MGPMYRGVRSTDQPFLSGKSSSCPLFAAQSLYLSVLPAQLSLHYELTLFTFLQSCLFSCRQNTWVGYHQANRQSEREKGGALNLLERHLRTLENALDLAATLSTTKSNLDKILSLSPHCKKLPTP